MSGVGRPSRTLLWVLAHARASCLLEHLPRVDRGDHHAIPPVWSESSDVGQNGQGRSPELKDPKSAPACPVQGVGGGGPLAAQTGRMSFSVVVSMSRAWRGSTCPKHPKTACPWWKPYQISQKNATDPVLSHNLAERRGPYGGIFYP